MSTQLTFSEEFYYADSKDGITVLVMLLSGTDSFQFDAKIDTGSEICLFSHEVGEKLNLQIEDGIPITISTLTGPLEAFGHEVTIQIGRLAFHGISYFAKYPGLKRNILGRQGWLRNLKVGIIDYDNLLYLSPYDE